jgi:hypothetical protein
MTPTQRAPYEAVVGRTRLSDLKRQLRLQAEHAGALSAQVRANARVRLGLNWSAKLARNGRGELMCFLGHSHAGLPNCVHQENTGALLRISTLSAFASRCAKRTAKICTARKCLAANNESLENRETHSPP